MCHEIDKWLCKHLEIRDYVILDDMDYKQFREEQRPYLVTTSHFSGLNKETAEKTIELLNSKES